MIFFLFGEDTGRSRDLLAGFVRRFQKIAPAAWHQLDCEEEDAQERLRSIAGLTLFGSKEYVIIKHLSSLRDEVASQLEALLRRWSTDQAVAVFYERGRPQSTLLELVEKYAFKKQEFKAAQRKPVSVDAAVFALTDLWGRRARDEAILKFYRLLESGLGPERILWAFLWHIKNLFLVKQAKPGGLHPFVASKAREQSKNFSFEELEEAFGSLVRLDESRKRGQGTLEAGLLQFLLTR